jgi:DNA-binding NarL/FixJ family response regulator
MTDACAALAAPEDGRAVAATRARAIRVLLCDDHAVVRVGLRRLLDSADGVEVVGTASDGAEGVDAAARLRPDVVLMDLSMPNVDGVEATRRIAARVPGTPVVVLTSFADQARIRRAIDAGASGYLLKDASPAELLHAVRGAVLDPG